MESTSIQGDTTKELTRLFRTSPAFSLARALEELGALLSALTESEYVGHSSSLFTSSVGAQVRHTLDHVRIFVEGVQEKRVVAYEVRDRGTEVERNREAALSLIQKLAEQLLQIAPSRMNEPLEVSLMLHSHLEPQNLHSTVGREIAFLLNHTIHHNALVAVMLKQIGREVPSTFGFAPATLAFQAGISSSS